MDSIYHNVNIRHNVRRNAITKSFYNTDLIEDKETPGILASDDIICFDVGGTAFQILKSKFAYWPKTRLSRLIRAKTKAEILMICNNFVVCKNSVQTKKYIFYRNGSNFNAILDTFSTCIELVDYKYS